MALNTNSKEKEKHFFDCFIFTMSVLLIFFLFLFRTCSAHQIMIDCTTCKPHSASPLRHWAKSKGMLEEYSVFYLVRQDFCTSGFVFHGLKRGKKSELNFLKLFALESYNNCHKNYYLTLKQTDLGIDWTNGQGCIYFHCVRAYFTI